MSVYWLVVVAVVVVDVVDQIFILFHVLNFYERKKIATKNKCRMHEVRTKCFGNLTNM